MKKPWYMQLIFKCLYYSPGSSKAVSMMRVLQLFLVQTRPSLQWLSRIHWPSSALQGLVFEQIFFSIGPEKDFWYLMIMMIFNRKCGYLCIVFYDFTETYEMKCDYFINCRYLEKLWLWRSGQADIQRLKLGLSYSVIHMTWLVGYQLP